MRKVSFGTSWQSKASMLPLRILIAQRLQIETLRVLTKVVERYSNSYVCCQRLVGSAKSTPAARLASTVA